jgi:hypothetical protein
MPHECDTASDNCDKTTTICKKILLNVTNSYECECLPGLVRSSATSCSSTPSPTIPTVAPTPIPTPDPGCGCGQYDSCFNYDLEVVGPADLIPADPAAGVTLDLIKPGGEITLAASPNVETVLFTFRPFANGLVGYEDASLPGCGSLSSLDLIKGDKGEGLWQCEYEYNPNERITAHPDVTHTPFNSKDFDFSYGLEAYVLIYARGLVGNETVVYAKHVFGVVGQIKPEDVWDLDMSNYYKEYDWPEAWQMLIIAGVLFGLLLFTFCFCYWLHNGVARKEVGLPESLQVRHAVIRQSHDKRSKEEWMHQDAAPISLGGLTGSLEGHAGGLTRAKAGAGASMGDSMQHSQSMSASYNTTETRMQQGMQQGSVLQKIQAETAEIERLKAQLSASKEQRNQIEYGLSTRAVTRVQSPATRMVTATTIVAESGNPSAGIYKELLEMAMADGEMDDAESRRLEEYREKHGISWETHTDLVAQLKGGLYRRSSLIQGDLAGAGGAGSAGDRTLTVEAHHTHTMSNISSTSSISNSRSLQQRPSGARSLQQRPSSANAYLSDKSTWEKTQETRLNLEKTGGPAPDDWDVSPPVTVAKGGHGGYGDEHRETFTTESGGMVAVPAGATVTVVTHDEGVAASDMTEEEALARLNVKAEDI